MPDSAPLMILVAGPYRSGTGDDPARIDANMRAMTEASLHLFRLGHLGVTGEALALPMLAAAGSTRIGDAAFDAIFHPVGRLLAERCDACLRIGGASVGADEMASIFERRGRPVYRSLAEIPPSGQHEATAA